MTRNEKPMRDSAGGKPVRWNENRPQQAYQIARLGHTEDEIAFAMGVHPKTIPLWKRRCPEFATALAKGKSEIDNKVISAILMCALGYYYTEQVAQVEKKTGKVTLIDVSKYKGPESWACKQWLTTRLPHLFSETHRIEVTNNHNVNINLSVADLSILSTSELEVMEKLGLSKMIGTGAEDIQEDGTDDNT